ncbi:MAG: sigma-70 family RNA polymerase sigma factor [Clostridia bacterium]|nr:sigma-70 family RNA polymerase sigma factor [Clostridia bacterium]
MQKIKYTFADGTTSEIEVTDELYALHLQIVQEEKRNHWRETRRHTSLNYLMELGVDFIDNAADSFAAVELREDDERIHKAISKLSCKQRALLEKVFYEGKTLTAIAKENNVSQPAITQQLATIYKKIKKLLEKTL